MQTQPDDSAFGSSIPTNLCSYDQMLIRLYALHNELSCFVDGNGIADRLCDEIQTLTHGQARLQLYRHCAPTITYDPSIIAYFIPMQCADREYGHFMVLVAYSAEIEKELSFPRAQVLAQTCAHMLYCLEMNLYLKQQICASRAEIEPLRPREQELLHIICRGEGCADEEIAQRIGLSPSTIRKYREQLYRKLQVHSSQQAAHTAFVSALYTPINGLAPKSKAHT